ncbi:hypothetical protein [Sulfitobacter sp.]|uniref:hypothetical protein n=1 Tax=Sulfitobacter sp. TaxID=1903071 RepID=UPI00300370AF
MNNVDANNPNSINATTLHVDGQAVNVDSRNLNAQGATSTQSQPKGAFLKFSASIKKLFDTVKNISFDRNRVDLNR